MSFIKDETSTYDVIIVGAGISGLSSAYFLKRKYKNLKILIIEGKDRIGGRTESVELDCGKKKALFDVGGQWVTDDQKNITAILKEFEIDTYKQFDSGKKIIESDKKIKVYNSSIPKLSIYSILDLYTTISRINSNAKKLNALQPFSNYELANKLDSMNLEQFAFNKFHTRDSKTILDAAVRTVWGLDLNQINALFALTYVNSSKDSTIESLTLTDKNCAQEKRIKGGAQNICKMLLDYVMEKSNSRESYSKILLNTCLKEVVQSETKENELVEVVVENTKSRERQSFRCKRLISSMPLNQYAFVKFQPELPFYKKNVFKFSQMGYLVKILITYEKPFWRTKGFSGEVVSDGSIVYVNNNRFVAEYTESIGSINFNKEMPDIGPISIVYDATTSNDDAALVCFIGGTPAIQWLDMSEELRKSEIIQSLVRYFGQEATNYVDYYEKNWNAEPFGGGCPAINLNSSNVMRDYARATREPFINVHFCGTESATQWIGYMDGAVESGERVANEVLFSLYADDSGKEFKIDYEKTYYYQRSLISTTTKTKEKSKKQSRSIIQSIASVFNFVLIIFILFYIYMRFNFA